MEGKPHRLYDEHLVHNIMLAAGISATEYLRENPDADSDEIGAFIDANADDIMEDTIKRLKSLNDFIDKGKDIADAGDDTRDNAGDWPHNEEG
jgi:hypothetical protein